MVETKRKEVSLRIVLCSWDSAKCSIHCVRGGVRFKHLPFPSIGAVALPHVIVTPVFPYELPLIQPHMVQLRAWVWLGVIHKCGGALVTLWVFKG